MHPPKSSSLCALAIPSVITWTCQVLLGCISHLMVRVHLTMYVASARPSCNDFVQGANRSALEAEETGYQVAAMLSSQREVSYAHSSQTPLDSCELQASLTKAAVPRGRRGNACFPQPVEIL